jgi:hypothetical protein
LNALTNCGIQIAGPFEPTIRHISIRHIAHIRLPLASRANENFPPARVSASCRIRHSACIGSIGLVRFSGWNADRAGKRVTHVAVLFLIGASGFVEARSETSGLMRLIGLVIGSAGVSAQNSDFWYIPSALLSGTAGAVAFALIYSIGDVGGFSGSTRSHRVVRQLVAVLGRGGRSRRPFRHGAWLSDMIHPQVVG